MAEPTAVGAHSDRAEVAALLGATRSRLGVVVALLTLAGLAWWSTATRMAGMDAGPGTHLGAFGWFTGVWAVMMAAMMLPSLAPTAALYVTLSGRREPSLWLFALGVMSLTWMALVAAVVALEKLTARPRLATSTAAALLAALAAAILIAPHDIPLLTVLDLHAATKAMKAMR